MKYWCEVHNREATYVVEDGTHHCDPKLGGIMMVCQVKLMPEENPKTNLRKSDSNKLAEYQINEWMARNREPGVLPCIPIIMISTLCGEKPGITVNLNKNMPLKDVALILKAASEQVEKAMGEVESN